ncbi:MAG: hypothetical protein ABI232_08920 [Jatrophihabitantaceae bacterium]
MRRTYQRRLRLPAAMILAAAVLAGCGSSVAGNQTGTKEPSTANTAKNVGTAPAGPAAAALDMCSLATAAQVSTVVGGTVVVRDGSGGSKCDFTSDERSILTPTIDDMSPGGYEQARSGASQVLTVGVKDLPGIGERAFVATGELASYRSAQGAVLKGANVVEVTFTSRVKTYDELSAMTQALLAIIAGNL